VRSKRHVRYEVMESRPVPQADEEIEIRSDQLVRLSGRWSRKAFTSSLRKVVVYVKKEDRTLTLLSNHLELSSQDIAQLYKSRWQVELFFKWIKQHLRLRTFYGRSQNAVRSQIWSALCVYLMVAIVKKELKLEKSLYEILQVVSVSCFENIGLFELLTGKLAEEKISDPQKLFSFNNK
jgi:IS4 transposase